MGARSAARHVWFHLGSALLAVVVLCVVPAVGARSLEGFAAGILALPFAAALLFTLRFCWKIACWMRAPIPFRISLTTGQHRGAAPIGHDRFRAPYTAWETFVRALLDLALFRPLLRTTPSVYLHARGLVAHSGRLLWLVAGVFHASLAIVLLRHLRFFLSPVPGFVVWLQGADSVSDLFIPKVHVTSVALLVALFWLLARRLALARLRYISLAADYFPLLLLIGVASSGILLRHVYRTDVGAVKGVFESAARFASVARVPTDSLLMAHVFLACTLVVYFPLSKLMHAPGAFMSPTLTLAANSRAKRHINVNNPVVPTLHYTDYEATFRTRMLEAGIPVEESESK